MPVVDRVRHISDHLDIRTVAGRDNQLNAFAIQSEAYEPPVLRNVCTADAVDEAAWRATESWYFPDGALNITRRGWREVDDRTRVG